MARTLNNEVDILNIASLDNDIKDSFTRAMISKDVNTTSVAARKYLKGEYFIHNDRCLYKALEEIAAGATITPDVNAELVTVSEELVMLFAQSPEGIFEILSNVQNGDTATRSFVKGEQIIWKDKQLYNVTADVTSGGTWTVGTNIALAKNLTSQIKTLNDNDDAMLNVLGAKNLLPNNATSQVFDRITYQVNQDGSVTALNGTALSGASLRIYADEIYCETDMILSGCPSGGSSSSYSIWCLIKNSQDGYADLGEGVLIPKGTTIYDICIGVAKDYTISNKTFYPMLRPASIADDTYVPYAATNRELTENEIIVKEYDYGSASIAANGSQIVSRPQTFPPRTLYGKDLIAMYVKVNSDYVVASISWTNKNIMAHNYYSSAQTISFSVVAFYR